MASLVYGLDRPWKGWRKEKEGAQVKQRWKGEEKEGMRIKIQHWSLSCAIGLKIINALNIAEGSNAKVVAITSLLRLWLKNIANKIFRKKERRETRYSLLLV